jgi:hypothetical protein
MLSEAPGSTVFRKVGDSVATSGFVGIWFAEEIALALEELISQYVTEVSLAEHNYMVKAFPSDRTD